MCDTKKMKRITQFKNNEFEGQGAFQMGECVPVFFGLNIGFITNFSDKGYKSNNFK